MNDVEGLSLPLVGGSRLPVGVCCGRGRCTFVNGRDKSAAFMSHDRIRTAAEGIFEVEDLVARDYQTMDAFYARVV